MDTYIFTRKGYAALLEVIRRTESMLNQAIEMKAEAGSSQDGWHDEGFKLGVVEEMTSSRRLGDLQAICSNARIIDPEEQNETAKLGNGITIEYEDGSSFDFILEGYAIEYSENRVSVHSPLGSAIIGAKEGEKKSFKVGDRNIVITVKKILPPSTAESLIPQE